MALAQGSHDQLFPGNNVRLDMFLSMLRIRMVEDALARLYPEQEMRCPVHLCTGQEAPPVGVSAHLTTADLVFSGHRSHGHYLAKGGNLKTMFAEIYGRVTGCARGKGGSQHLIDLGSGFMGSAPILASTVSVAVGAAWASVMEGKPRLVVAYTGDGATEEGAFHEALNFAGTKRLPVLFVCENNLYSVHSAKDVRQPDRMIADLAPAHGLLGLTGDGNDIDEVHRLAGEAAERARKGLGGAIIELATYRWAEHCGPNDDINLGYRSQAEFDVWKARDPLVVARDRLTEEGLLDAPREHLAQELFAKEIDEAVRFAKESPFPPPEELYAHVFPKSGVFA
jgi:TPP-dependent pyruvate/acetoin dehydrogenase alpha subunit